MVLILHQLMNVNDHIYINKRMLQQYKLTKINMNDHTLHTCRLAAAVLFLTFLDDLEGGTIFTRYYI